MCYCNLLKTQTASERFMLENFRRAFPPDQTDFPSISSQGGKGLDSHRFLALFSASVHANLVSRSPKAKGIQSKLINKETYDRTSLGLHMTPVATPFILPSPQALQFPKLHGERGTSEKRERWKQTRTA